MNTHDRVEEFLDACLAVNIKDAVEFICSKRPVVYDWLKGAFPRGGGPSDIDGIVEINGQFLVLEFKHDSVLREDTFPKGQRKLLERLTKTGLFTVFIIGHDKGEFTCIEMLWPDHRSGLLDVNKAGVRALCRRWAAWAEPGKRNGYRKFEPPEIPRETEEKTWLDRLPPR